MHHIRLTPYDESKGALCRRLTVAGQQFREGEWYDMEPQHSELLRPLKQQTGCPYFQIVETEDEWREIVRQELAAAMAGPEAAAMARFFSQAAPKSGPRPKAAGEVLPSAFDGIKAAPVEPGAIGETVGRQISHTTPEPAAEATSAPKKKSPSKRGRGKKSKK
jgi:hypothetical protein